MKLGKIVKCKHCGQVAVIVKNTSVPIICCGDPMEEVIPGTVDAALEKHVPVIEKNGNIVTIKVGEVEHPMTKEHYIEFIALQTKSGFQRAYLEPDSKPIAKFVLSDDDEILSAFAFCNLHGLWKK